MRSIIERVYARLLRESSLDGLDTSGMAAVVDDGGNYRTAVVYRVPEVSSRRTPQSEIPAKDIVGFVKVAQPRGAACRGAWQVKGITGPGKLVYGLAYALSPSGLVMPDRSDVSPQASSAWKAYAAKSGPQNILPLDDADHPKRGTDKQHDKYHTEDPQDDCYTSHSEDHLNAAYRGPGGEGALLDRLMDAHEALMSKLKKQGVDTAELESAILDAGYAKFDGVMGY
jgi:hypothetical protein